LYLQFFSTARVESTKINSEVWDEEPAKKWGITAIWAAYAWRARGGQTLANQMSLVDAKADHENAKDGNRERDEI